MTANMMIATACWLALVLGYLYRKDRRIHVPLVLAGILGDLGLVLYLQFSRDAVQKALEFSLAIFQQLHVACSLLATILYFPVLYLGFKLLFKRASLVDRERHIKVAKLALIFRTLGFFLMFSMWKS